MIKELPKEITSYDLLKCAAVLLMVADHIGWYFFPDDQWWRVFGRLCVPVWFFLIGYARSRDVGWKLWAGGLVLLLANMVAGMYVLPLNILATILIVRLLLDGVMSVLPYNRRGIFAFAFGMLLLTFHTAMFFEYGLQALTLAMAGYLVRNCMETRDDRLFTILYGVLALAAFAVVQQIMFEFSGPQGMVMCLGLIPVAALLYRFRPLSFAGLTRVLPPVAVWLIQFGGRRTLEIYVIHLLLFKTIAVLLFPERFELFHFSLFYEE